MTIENIDINALSESLRQNAEKKRVHPSDKETRELVKKIREGDQAAFNSLVERNQRLVITIAENYSQNADFVNDLIQEGNMGLIRAIQKFNVEGETRLSTYASIWIKSNIETYISKSAYSFKVPQASRKLALKTFKMYERLLKDGVSESNAVKHISEDLKIEEHVAVKLISLKNACVSMQERRYRHSGDDSQELQDAIASDESIEKTFEKNSLKEKINNQVVKLPEKQKEAVSLYYGLRNYPEISSFSNIARHMNITREYARILYNKGMKDLGERSDDFQELIA